MDRVTKRRTNLLYNLRKKGVRCLSKLLLAKILCEIFKLIDKYIKSRDNK